MNILILYYTYYGIVILCWYVDYRTILSSNIIHVILLLENISINTIKN